MPLPDADICEELNMRFMIIVFSLFMLTAQAHAGLLINEIACGTSGGDWVELFFQSDAAESINISGLYVTMYYGTNESLSSDPVTLYSYDRPETPYDDRFAVVYLTDSLTKDETDLTGDTNNNGIFDIYCGNYSSSLWNTDCVVAIDTDDDPTNGGILDFAAYSSRDGEANDTIASYVENAAAAGQWPSCPSANMQDCMIDIGEDGLPSSMTISRKNPPDTNSQDDFSVTAYMTPGKMNIFSGAGAAGKKLFRTVKKKITVIPSHPVLGSGNVDLFVYQQCSIRFRVFSSIGLLLYESPLYSGVNPGNFSVKWDLRGKNRNACTGLYLGYIEAVSSALRKTEVEKIYLMLSRYR